MAPSPIGAEEVAGMSIAALQRCGPSAACFGTLLIATLSAAALPQAARAQEATVGLPLLPLEAAPTVWERLREEMEAIRDPHLRRNLQELRYLARFSVPPQLARQIQRAAEAEGIDPEIGFRLVWAESRFHPRARGPRGALGLMQVMPGTARAVDPRLRSEADILDPDNNLRVGFRYFRQLLDRYDGDLRLALLAYNRGPGTVDRHLRQGRDPENGYSRRVLGSGAQRYRGSGTTGAPR
jgi:soluble lytic murein transglycosylase-like protein